MPESDSKDRHPGSPRRRKLTLWLGASALVVAASIAAYLSRGAPASLSGRPEERDASHRTAGTRRMAERLAAITAATPPALNIFRNSERAALLEKAAGNRASAPPPLLMELGTELLNAGRNDDAIAVLAELEGRARAHTTDRHSPHWIDLRLRQAIAQLRRAETENCLEHHNPLSCIFPVRGEGVHQRPEGARAAAAVLTSLLEDNPEERQARWLLNIAIMTLGEYPQGVPQHFLMPPALFDSKVDLGRFPDVAAMVGLDVDDLAGGVAVDDFDGDGDYDLFVSAMGVNSQLRYFRNEGDGTFTDVTEEAGILGLTGGLNIVQADYDNDGRLDLLVLRGGWMGRGGHYPKSLLHNDGGGRFSDVTEAAGITGEFPSQTAVWRDFNGDGWLDLFVGNEASHHDPSPSQLFRGNGDGTFTECAAEAGVALSEFVKGVTAADYDDDGRPDIYVSVRGGANHLFHNVGAFAKRGTSWAGRFVDTAQAAGVTAPEYSFPAMFFDYDNDGHEDLFVSGYALNDPGDIARDVLGEAHGSERARLYHNRGNGTFEDVSHAAGLDRLLLSMGSNYGDFDNDGWLDLYLGTGDPDLGRLLPNRAFRNAEGRFFQDVTTSTGLGHLQKGHSVAFADLDNDGDQDIYQVVGGAFEADHFRNALYENPGHGHHFVVLQLEGVRSNRAAIGARLRVDVRTTGGGRRSLYRTVSNGGSFGGSPLRQEIGLGEAEAIEQVVITWPSGGPPQTLMHLDLDGRYRVREGDGAPQLLELPRVTLGGARAAATAPAPPPPARGPGVSR
jgi:hypothetical protein